ncbi:MAG TPA: DUF1015 domain-containing protein [Vicinamibacteria bacterium]|nr:DUF1015 domain-containing protein [Vicinamibacteria bacterium]
MPDIQPFRGLRYRVPDLSRVLCPPYDVITATDRDELYARDSRNIVRVVLNRTPGDAAYDEAGATFRGWVAAGLLAPDPEPALYLVEQTFEVDGRDHRRYGLLARFRVEEPSRGRVLPHEHTRKEAKEDRYKLLKATRANFSPIFLMFSDREGALRTQAERTAARAADFEYTDDGAVRHRVWRVQDGAAVSALQSTVGSEKAYIADGHHRWATAQRYHREVGEEAAWTLGYFTPMEDEGLVVLPYHRLLDGGPSLEEARRALQERFELTEVEGAGAAARAAAGAKGRYAFALVEPGGAGVLAQARTEAESLLPADAPPSLRALDTYFLHQVVLPRVLAVPEEAVRYAHSLAEVEETLQARRCRLAVLMRPTPVAQIVDVADAGESMPAKSTFFHPKLPSGLVIHPLHG